MIQKYGIDPLVLKLKQRDSVSLRRVISSEPHLEYKDAIAYAYSMKGAARSVQRIFQWLLQQARCQDKNWS